MGIFHAVLRRGLTDWLDEWFIEQTGAPNAAASARKRFLQVIEERTGLLAARGEGGYSFFHLTFQEYLAALAIAGRDDYIPYTTERMHEAWWREVVLLEAGYPQHPEQGATHGPYPCHKQCKKGTLSAL